MNLKMIFKIIAYLLGIECALMLPSLGISYYLHETKAVNAFLISIAITAIIAIVLYLCTRKVQKKRFYAREGLVTTGISWIVISLLGALPFYFSGAIPQYIDAVFETVSGFTTTGSSILLEVESMPKGLLFWRSVTHWVGGMGVLVFLMSIVSLGTKNECFSLHLIRA